MKNKGQFFEIYLVVFLGFLCALVIYTYLIQQSEARSSLISPNSILEARDNSEIFKLKEKELILESLEETKKTAKFGENAFTSQFNEIFINKIKSKDGPKEFLFKDYIRENEARENEENFIRSIYSADYNKEENKIIFARAKLEKRIYLKAGEENKINFPVEVSFTTGEIYLISFSEDKFILEEKQ